MPSGYQTGVTNKANKGNWDSGKKTVTTAGTAVQLPSLAIPEGFTIILKALLSNTDKINVAETKANAEDDDTSFELNNEDTLTLQLKNLNLIWVDSDVDGEGLTYAVEAD